MYDESDMGADAIGSLQAEIDALKAKAAADAQPKIDLSHAVQTTKGTPMAAPKTIKVNLKAAPLPKQDQPATQENVQAPAKAAKGTAKNLNYALPGGVAGGVVGFAVAGPVGAALGAGVGGAGGFLFGRWKVYSAKKK